MNNNKEWEELIGLMEIHFPPTYIFRQIKKGIVEFRQKERQRICEELESIRIDARRYFGEVGMETPKSFLIARITKAIQKINKRTE